MKIKFKKVFVFLLVVIISVIPIPCSNVKAEMNKNTDGINGNRISLNESNLFLELDQSQMLIVTFHPKASANSTDLVWTSSDLNVVSVHNGIVYAKGLGTAYVYANHDNSIAFCKITVIRYNPVKAVQIKNYIGYTGTDLEVVKKAEEVIDNNIMAGMRDEEKMKAIHRYLLNNCEFYNLDLHNTKQSYYGLVGTLLEKTAISQGYAYTFKYFMDILGISTRISERKSFMWNQVYLYERWYAINIPIDELSYRNTELYFDPEHSNVPDNQFSDMVIQEEVNYEYILSEYGKGTYGGNEAAVLSYLANKTSQNVTEYTVILDPNYSFSKQFQLENNDKITEQVHGKDYYIPNNLPYIKNTKSIYVSSLNTRPDGTGISYPNNFVKGIKENLYLYCIWDVQIDPMIKVNITGGKGSLNGYWEKLSGCKNYELRYATNSSMQKAVTKKVNGLKAKISGLKHKTTYYVQVRGYIKDDNGKIIYGKWSVKDKVITK